MTTDKTNEEIATNTQAIDSKESATQGDNNDSGEKSENVPTVSKEEEEEEDIPADFFDDFSNQDFMEGLDVVDTWDDEMQEEGEVKDDNKTEDHSKEEKSENDTRDQKKTESKHSSNSNKHARITFSKEREAEQKSSKSRNVERGPRYKDLREKLGWSEEKTGLEARRRDPEKTRRDILRDKDRCAKDKEVKMMKEKLKVVETGLVPPGMETEIDLADISNKQVENRTKADNSKIILTSSGYLPKVDQKGTKTILRSRSRSYDRYRFRERLRSRSGSRGRERRRLRDDISPIFRKRFRSRSRTRSPLYGTTRYMRLKERNLSRDRERKLSRDKDKNVSRERDRKLSREGDRKLSRDRERKLSLDRNISRERKSSRHRTGEKDRSRSRSSNKSEREKWLTRRLKRSLSPRHRSISPNRKRVDYKKEITRRVESDPKEDKPTFLEEINRKLNERTHHSPQVAVQHTMQMRTTYVPYQTPLPVPSASQQEHSFAPQMVPPVQYDQSVSQYDQQFFIGTNNIPQPVGAPLQYIQPKPVPPPCPVVSTQNQNLLVSSSYVSPSIDYSITRLIEENPLFPSPTKEEKEKKALEDTDKKALAKLLEDKKISLSDFLTITSRPSASRPINLQEKISVITRCQDAIKELGGDAKTTGRLIIKKCKVPEIPERQHASPLRKIPIVRLNFTSLAKPDEDTGFSATVNKLLKTLGLFKESQSEKEQAPELPDFSNQKLSRRKQKRMIAAAKQQLVDATTPATHLMKMCQTDPYKCEKCEERSLRTFEVQAVQCDIKTFVDACTQTYTEESTQKTKSLSHMTPAEILAELEKKKKEEANKIKIECMNDLGESGEDESRASGSTLQNMERSVELDHNDKDISEGKISVESSRPDWKHKNNSFNPRKSHYNNPRGGGPPYFRNARGFYNFRPDSRPAYYADDLDVYSANYDEDEEEYEYPNYAQSDFRNFHGGPSHQRPFYEPPENVRRKFNRRFM